MNKIWLIARREYLTRVRNKTFILSTFLLPLVFVLFITGSVLIAMQTHTHHRIAVIDGNGFFKDYLKGDSTISFVFSPEIDTLNYAQKGCTSVLIIPSLQDSQRTLFRLKYKKQLGLDDKLALENRINNAITDHLIYEKTAVSRAQLDSIRKRAAVADLRQYEDNGATARASNQELATLIGFVSSFLIYLLTFIYGAMVMRGVMEEKTNRIAEVIVSSVKPFQLMMGKITGIGSVGLTQFLMWIVMMVVLTVVASAFIPASTWHEVQQLQHAGTMGSAGTAIQASEAANRIYNIESALSGGRLLQIVLCFLFYFLGGYLFYSALFAAIGSAVNEDPQEAQSLMLPITMPVVFSFIIMTVAVRDPSGPLAVWASIIPFSSPIDMMARIPFGVPWWQLGLSMALLVLGFLATTWLAGKIYRTGILMYGKKASWKVLWRWAFRS